MSKQVINLGTAPTGVGGDTPRSAFTKAQSNFDELYAAHGASGSPLALPAFLPVANGGTGNATGTATRLAAAAMVGTVSQSSGVPTGAIVEKGSTASGEFTKFADGTMICWRSVSFASLVISATAGGVAYVGLNGISFPATFGNLPVVTMSAIGSGGLAWVAMGSALPSASATQAYFLIVPVAGTYSFTVQVMAMGRWF